VLTATVAHYGVAQVAGDLTELLPELGTDYATAATSTAATSTAAAATTTHTAAAGGGGHRTAVVDNATAATTNTAAGDTSSDEDEDVLCIQVHTVNVKAGFKVFEIPLG
jgi:hypothetical protein